MLAQQAISVLSGIINDESLINDAQILPASFTRKRKITLDNLLSYLIFRNHNVLSEDLVSYFGTMGDFDIPTRQAVIKRMSILNYDVWYSIMDRFRNEIYNELPLVNIKDYVIVAVDGSFLDLPSHIALNHCFGGHRTSKIKIEDIKKPQAKVSMIYDVLNRVILDFSVSHYRTSEIPLLFEHLKRLKEFFGNRKIILLADRYYGSAELFRYCEMHHIKYIIRAKKNFFKHYIEEFKEEKDFYISIKFDKAWIKRIRNDEIRKSMVDNPKMDIRVIRGTYTYIEKNKKKEREVTVETQYFTNLNDEFDISNIVDLYHHERWNVETAYDVLKNNLDIEQYNTHNPIGIINETMGKVIFYNIEQIIFIESKKRIKQNNECRYKYIPNNKHIINLLHHNNFVVNFKKGSADVIVNKIVVAGSKEKIPIRKGRHYKRWNKFLKSIPRTRHRIDGRRNPLVAKGKTGFVTTNH
ncbi:Transposase DDE domain-containing protein [Thomasclavelia cocleata]|uniref:Transposase DDE domain-containing protein n=1 Tax=Thomasclavelia cocleata TaxID=69824 RepID=A0A1I0HQQ2_9FIRM|nr:IS4 family transposase [Thomasclavelia cocleata]MCR1961871.1 IS4 family transposase [Thomasclavelia cocleata]NDO43078.1 IS4 family transposase [Thomasclavelia cocleata]SET86463.1 Transposase DDE domain-containing protein [Thomasclavelia cocleata]